MDFSKQTKKHVYGNKREKMQVQRKKLQISTNLNSNKIVKKIPTDYNVQLKTLGYSKISRGTSKSL